MLLQVNPITGLIQVGFTGLAQITADNAVILPTQFADGTFWDDGPAGLPPSLWTT